MQTARRNAELGRKNGGNSVIVTGTSTGIGKTLGLALAKQGYRVFATVRKIEDAEALKSECDDLVPVIMDVTDGASIQEALVTISEQIDGGQVNLVNNAGIAMYGPIETYSMARLKRQFEVNLFGALAVTRAFLPLIRRGGNGRIINIGSVGGRISVPLAGPYCASKAALRSATGSLLMELAGEGIRVSLVEPGVIATPIFRKSQSDMQAGLENWTSEYRDRYGKAQIAFMNTLDKTSTFSSSPQTVVRVVSHILTTKRPKAHYRVGFDARLLFCVSLLPARIQNWLIRRAYGLK